MKKKSSKPWKPTRAEILRATRVEMRPPKGVPQEVIEEVERRQDDYIVAWVQGLNAHLDKVEAARSRSRKRSRGKATKATDERTPEEWEKALQQPVISIERMSPKRLKKQLPEGPKRSGQAHPRRSGKER